MIFLLRSCSDNSLRLKLIETLILSLSLSSWSFLNQELCSARAEFLFLTRSAEEQTSEKTNLMNASFDLLLL
jgi:hypothetical protein